MKRILIASPIKQNHQILKQFLIGLEELNLDELSVEYYFVDDNTDHKSSSILADFVKKHRKVILKKTEQFNLQDNQAYKCNEHTHFWKKSLIERIIIFKNAMIKYAKDENFDYLFLVDSDIVMNPNTINHLISRKVDIVSNIFWTIWKTGGTLSPQVWLQDENASYIRDWDQEMTVQERGQATKNFINKLKVPGLYKVGGLGACTLISKKAIKSGVDFSLIDNVSFWGEDRHFCIRARVLGLGLYVDTVYPAYHIYRKQYLTGVADYKKNGFDPNAFLNQPLKKDRLLNILSQKFNKINLKQKIKLKFKKLKRVLFSRKRVVTDRKHLTLSMTVYNESDRYLEKMLEATKDYVDQYVIIDDASTDNTAEICQKVLHDKPLKLIKNEQRMFTQEYKLRQKQWRETIATNPDWILFLDADEIFESSFAQNVKFLLSNKDIDAYCFKLYDMWDDEHHYRSDELWRNYYRPFLIRYQPKFHYKFLKTNQHCGRLPVNVRDLNYVDSDFRIKHLGWMKKQDRLKKYKRYQELDPEAKYGNQAQYDSILDKSPNLELFDESS